MYTEKQLIKIVVRCTKDSSVYKSLANFSNKIL